MHMPDRDITPPEINKHWFNCEYCGDTELRRYATIYDGDLICLNCLETLKGKEKEFTIDDINRFGIQFINLLGENNLDRLDLLKMIQLNNLNIKHYKDGH